MLANIANTGSFFLMTAFLLSFFLSIGGFFSHNHHWVKYYILGIFLCILGAFFSLMYAYVTSDFSLLNVAMNSHTAKPLLYKITGLWANHEGSMLLWVLILSLFGVMMAYYKPLNKEAFLQRKSLIIHSIILCFFLGFILFTSDPFTVISPAPINGNGLNPLLQDVGLAFHPPLLYLGYVGFSAVFSLACGGLWAGNIDKNLGNILYFWCLLAWSFLTAGIGLGMWWAYYELGWGGFWFWDPVENASLMPWLAGTALLHSIKILQKRELLKKWTMILAILTFSFSLLGAFIVRSGIIASVHSFAASPERGLFILIIMLILVAGAFILFAWRLPKLTTQSQYSFFSREMALILNNYFLCGILLIIFTGTLYPTLLEAFTGSKITVGAPYFNQTIFPFIVCIAILCPLGGMMRWRYNLTSQTLKKILSIMLIFLLGVFVALFLWTSNIPKNAYYLLLMAAWIIIGTLLDIWIKSKMVSWRLIFREDFAKIAAHLGLALLMIGITGVALLKHEETFLMKKGEVKNIRQEQFRLMAQTVTPKDNYISDKVIIRHEGHRNYTTERRFFPVSRQTTTEADISLNIWRDIYITIGTLNKDSQRMVNIRIHPLALFLWLSIILASCGGIISLWIGRNKY